MFDRGSSKETYDAVIVGASLAGCSAAILLARAGARVALVEQRQDMDAFKRICTHYIQSSAVPSLERLGLLEPMLNAGALRSRARLRTRWGWIEPSTGSGGAGGVNLRREILDPLIRGIAAETTGVELLLGRGVRELVWDRPSGSAENTGAVCGVIVGSRDGSTQRLFGKLTVGADGRGSRVAKLARMSTRSTPNQRFVYGGYFEGPTPAGAPHLSLWLLDPDAAAAFPTDGGMVFYACMPTKARLNEFRGDPELALREFVAALPDAPPIRASRLVQPIQGKLDMANIVRAAAAPGVALIGDAALAIDPMWGVGCGWALQSAEWLADSVTPALLGGEPLRRGLVRYRRRRLRSLHTHAAMIRAYSSGRRFNPGERMLFSAAPRDSRLGGILEEYAARNIGPGRMLAQSVPLAVVAHARHATLNL